MTRKQIAAVALGIGAVAVAGYLVIARGRSSGGELVASGTVEATEATLGFRSRVGFSG